MAEPIRFVLFGQGRTGSKLLLELLRSHPDIQCDGELLGRFAWGRFGRRLLLPLLRRWPLPLFRHRARQHRERAYGFKLFLNHLERPERVLAQLHREGWKIIRLRRRDLIQQIFSNLVATRTDRWHSRQGEARPATTLAIPPAEFVEAVGQALMDKAKIDRLLAEIPHLELIYEEELADAAAWEGTSQRLLQFLGVPFRPLATELAKTWGVPYAELVANHGSLMQELGGLLPSRGAISATDEAKGKP